MHTEGVQATNSTDRDTEGRSLSIRLLGCFEVHVGARPIGDEEWRLRKAKSLVKLLALAPNRRMHREELMDILWPYLDPEAASRNLRKALHVARRAFDPDSAIASLYLNAQEDVLVLRAPGSLSIDVEGFEEAAARAQRTGELEHYQEATALYTGELLPEDRYEEWTILRRDELRSLCMRLLITLGHMYEERGDVQPAAATLRSAVAIDALSEEARAGLM